MSDITGLGSIADLAKNLINRISPPDIDPNVKAENITKVEGFLQETKARTSEAKRDVIVEELKTGDKYTIRARPTVVYSGIVALFLSHIIFPIMFWVVELIRMPSQNEAVQTIINYKPLTPPDLSLPLEFWVAWGGVTGTYAVGRTAEKFGIKNKLVSMITGN